MKEKLNIHFIWCGSDLNNDFVNNLIKKYLVLKAYFINYDLILNIWLDRSCPAIIFQQIKTRLYTTKIYQKNIFDLFNKLENDHSILIRGLDKRSLRYTFSNEIGSLAPYTTDQSKDLARSYKPMPAIAADIIKFLLGLYTTGLYVDIGLDVSLPPARLSFKYCDHDLHRDLIHIIDNNRKFHRTITLAFTTQFNRFMMDFQLLYFTDNKLCRNIYKKIIEVILSSKHNFRAINHICRTYDSHDEFPISWTAQIVNLDCLQDDLFQVLFDKFHTIKPEYVIPLENNCRTIAGFTYKTRESSFIDDYKKKMTDAMIREKLKRTKISRRPKINIL